MCGWREGFQSEQELELSGLWDCRCKNKGRRRMSRMICKFLPWAMVEFSGSRKYNAGSREESSGNVEMHSAHPGFEVAVENSSGEVMGS